MPTISPVPTALGNGILDATPTLIYEVPPSISSTTIRSITCPNLTSGPHALSVWLVPSGGSPDDTNAICNALEIPARGLMSDDSPHVLETGDRVYGAGDVANVFSMRLDGAENTVTP